MTSLVGTFAVSKVRRFFNDRLPTELTILICLVVSVFFIRMKLKYVLEVSSIALANSKISSHKAIVKKLM